MNHMAITQRAAPRISMDRILHPKSVAVLGASASVAKFGGRIMHFLVKHGFEGAIYPINNKRDEIAGYKALSVDRRGPDRSGCCHHGGAGRNLDRHPA